MESPKCKLCGLRHYGLCVASPVPTVEHAATVQPGLPPPPPPRKPKPIQQSTVQLQGSDMAGRLRAMVSMDRDLLNQAADLIEQLSLHPGMTPERRARKRDYMRDYMRRKRAEDKARAQG